MEYLGYINAEGGPLLVADGSLVSGWKGIDGADYDRACSIFDSDTELEGSEIDLEGGKGILWEMKGPGTAFAYRHGESHYVIVRLWPRDPMDLNAPDAVAQQPMERVVRIGALSIQSGILALFWAVEDGSGMKLPPGVDVGRPIGDLSIENAGLILRVPNTIISCFHDEVDSPAGIGRRLHLVASQPLEVPGCRTTRTG
jgi:hypothetical protein